jgi:hypothetical protein
MAKRVPAYAFVNGWVTLSNFVIGATMIVVAIGILQLRPVARVIAICCCVYELLSCIVFSGYSALFAIPATQDILAAEMANNPQAPFDIEKFSIGAMWFSLGLAILLVLGLCVPVIFLLRTPAARKVFADEFESDTPERHRRRFPEQDDADDDLPPPSFPRRSGDTGFADRPF